MPTINGNGIVVAWNHIIPELPVKYAEGLCNDLIVSSGGNVWWHNDTVNSGISYINGENAGFFPFSDYVSVSCDFGLIFDASSGKMYLDVQESGKVEADNPEYFEGKDVTWIGTIGTLTLQGFSWTTSASTALTVVGQSVALDIKDNSENSFVSSNNVWNSYGINFTFNTVITGDGILNAFSGDSSGISCGIVAMDNLAIDGVDIFVNAIAGVGTVESFGIYFDDDISYGLTISDGTVVAQGETSAISISHATLPVAYTYWTNTVTSDPNTAGTLYYPDNGELSYVYDTNTRYVKIASERIIIIKDVTVTGTVGASITATLQATIVLYGDTVLNTLTDASCSSWFNNLPYGMTVTANAVAGEDRIVLTFTGTPATVSTNIFDITIPASILTKSVTDINVETNASANFDIMPPPPKLYDIMYHGNGYTHGTIPIDNNNPYENGDQVTVMGQGSMSKTGYIFLGWNTTSTATTPKYLPNSVFTITSDTTLYAIWAAINYTVTYDPGTHVTFKTQTTNNLHYGDQTPNAPTITSEAGWTFTGWIPTPSTTVTSNATYTAQWTQTTTPSPSATPPPPSTSPSQTPTSSPPPFRTPVPPPSLVPTPSLSPPPSSSAISSQSPAVTPTSDPKTVLDDAADEWAVVNSLICVIGIILAVFTAIYLLLINERKQDNQKLGQLSLLWLVTAIVLAAVGVIVFLLTEDLNLPFGWVTDKWTILNTAILATEIIAIWLCLKTAKTNKSK
jgi:uncharacterized repeat protein (TIGR02543 family)